MPVYVCLLNMTIILWAVFTCGAKKKSRPQESWIERSAVKSPPKKPVADQKAASATPTDRKADKESDKSGDKIKPNSANVQKSEKPQTGEQPQQTANAVEQPQPTPPTAATAVPAQNETPKIEKTVVFSLSEGSGSKKSEENKQEISKRLGGEDSKKKIIGYSPTRDSKNSAGKKGETKSPTKVNEGEIDDKTSGPDETQRTVAATAETQATDYLVSTFDTENRTQKSELSIRMSEMDGNNIKKKPEEGSTSNKTGDKPLSRSEGKKADKEGLSNSDEKKSKAERPENMGGSWKEGDLRKKVKSKSKKEGQLKGGDKSKRVCD